MRGKDRTPGEARCALAGNAAVKVQNKGKCSRLKEMKKGNRGTEMDQGWRATAGRKGD